VSTAERLRDTTDLFEGLPDEAIDQLDDRIPATAFAKGELIYSPFDRADAIYLVETGRVRLYRSAPDGRQLTLAMLDRGMAFGQVGAVEHDTFDCYAEAMEETRVRTLRLAELERVIATYPQVAVNLLRTLAERLRGAEDQLESMAFHGVPSRLAAKVLELMERYGRVTSSGIRIDQRFTHMQLAEMIGTSRETLTKVINDLREAGLVDVRERMVWVLDVDGLERLKHSG
jgi:CRP/FNR family transcriptional regulator